MKTRGNDSAALKNCRGYALMEALFSVIILSAGIVLAVQAFRSAARFLAVQRRQFYPAVQLADMLLHQKELERLQSLPAAPLPDSMNVVVEESEFAAAPGLKQVSVKIPLKSGREIRMTTLLPAKK